MKKYTITVNGTAYEVEVEEAGVVASAPKAAPKAAPAPFPTFAFPQVKLLLPATL